ncbi:MAG: calcium/sodium antiporter [Eubacteriales bacterium]|nr:calcium/sodium antiporter [Eubacteriales bacterium]
MLMPVLLFLLGFILLIKGGDWFVDGAVGIAHRFRLPELLIGATVVSIGTTLPEVMVSCQAALQGNSGISYGNAIGSIICNTSLIAAVTVAAKPGPVSTQSLRVPALFFACAAVLYVGIAVTAGRFARWQGLLFLAIFFVYMIVSVRQMKTHPEGDSGSPGAPEADAQGRDDSGETEENGSSVKDLLLLAVGAAAIAVGAKLLVDNGTLIAQWLGVPDSVIGLTMIALGTSLPELITAITSLMKGHGALSLGNIIGANLFNIVLVSGAAISLHPFTVPAEKMIGGINSSFVVDLPVMVGVMAILCVPAFLKERLSRWQGILLLCIYAVFTVYQFIS